MGTSSRGYEKILFGSMCKNVKECYCIYSPDNIKNPINMYYSNLKTIINKKNHIFYMEIKV